MTEWYVRPNYFIIHAYQMISCLFADHTDTGSAYTHTHTIAWQKLSVSIGFRASKTILLSSGETNTLGYLITFKCDCLSPINFETRYFIKQCQRPDRH